MKREAHGREQKSAIATSAEKRTVRSEESAENSKRIQALCFEPQNQSRVSDEEQQLLRSRATRTREMNIKRGYDLG